VVLFLEFVPWKENKSFDQETNIFSVTYSLPVPGAGPMKKANYFFSYIRVVPNITVEWIALLAHIQEVPGSKLLPKTPY
jgi:hypothetical protein